MVKHRCLKGDSPSLWFQIRQEFNLRWNFDTWTFFTISVFPIKAKAAHFSFSFLFFFFWVNLLWSIYCSLNLIFIDNKIFIAINVTKILTFFSSVQFSRSVVSNSLRPHEPQHARPPCQPPTPRVHPNSCPLSQWCHPTISSSVVPFSSCRQSFPASGSF